MSTAPSELAAHGLAESPARRDAYLWRLSATALSFAAFGAAAVIVGGMLLPIVRLAPASRSGKRQRARAVVRSSLKLFIGLMRGLGVMTYEFKGVDRLGRPGQLIVANHPSLIDVLFLLAFTPGAGCVVKHGLWRNPLTRAAVTLAEYISNESTASMIDAAAETLQTGETLIMFPEGTRTTPGKALTFHRGASSIGLRAARAVTPVYISVSPTTLTKAEPWYRIPSRRPHFQLIVGDDLDLDHHRRGPLPLASRQFNALLHEHFAERAASAR